MELTKEDLGMRPPAKPQVTPQPLSDEDLKKIVDAVVTDINFWSNVGIHEDKMIAKITNKVIDAAMDENSNLGQGLDKKIETDLAVKFEPLKLEVKKELKKVGVDEDRVNELMEKTLDPIKKDVEKDRDADRKRIEVLETTAKELDEQAVKSFGEINKLENIRRVDRKKIENLELEVGELRMDFKNLTAWLDSLWNEPVEIAEKKEKTATTDKPEPKPTATPTPKVIPPPAKAPEKVDYGTKGNKHGENLGEVKEEILERAEKFKSDIKANGEEKPADTSKVEPVKKPAPPKPAATPTPKVVKFPKGVE